MLMKYYEMTFLIINYKNEIKGLKPINIIKGQNDHLFLKRFVEGKFNDTIELFPFKETFWSKF